MLSARPRCATVAVLPPVLWALLAAGEGHQAGEWQPEAGVQCDGSRCEVVAATEFRAEGGEAGEGSGSPPPDRPRESPAAGRPEEEVLEVVRCEVSVPDADLTRPVTGDAELDCGDGGAPQPAADEQLPRTVAERAVRELALPAPVLRLSPSERATQMVGVPTWLWVDRSVWRPVSETARVRGVAVTATATPQRVTWSMGEGGRVVCDGPGTPYTEEVAPEAASPDCGYIYGRSSVDRSGGVFVVSAAIEWQVSWRGGGASGRVPGLVTRDEIAVPVDEIQALVSNEPSR